MSPKKKRAWRPRYTEPLAGANQRRLTPRDLTFLDLLTLDWMKEKIGLRIRVLHFMETETRYLRRKHPDATEYWMQVTPAQVWGLAEAQLNRILHGLEADQIITSQMVGRDKWWRLAKENWEFVARGLQGLPR